MRRVLILLGMVLALPLVSTGVESASAQSIRTIDPNSAIDADLDPPKGEVLADERVDAGSEGAYAPDATGAPYVAPVQDSVQPLSPASPAGTASGLEKPEAPTTFDRVRVVAAAEGVFGKGATGLAALLEDVLKDQGEPNAYIAGSEGSGAIILGLRYGSGQMVHAVEGESKVFWTGPSVGFDVGGDANKVFVLVYNLYDGQELYKRFPAGEGRVYFVGGFSATYLRRGDVVLIPIRLGVGWRAGVNVGYMKFSEKSRWFPF